MEQPIPNIKETWIKITRYFAKSSFNDIESYDEQSFTRIIFEMFLDSQHRDIRCIAKHGRLVSEFTSDSVDSIIRFMETVLLKTEIDNVHSQDSIICIDWNACRQNKAFTIREDPIVSIDSSIAHSIHTALFEADTNDIPKHVIETINSLARA